jgi:outer membrane protein assembly factor BamB
MQIPSHHNAFQSAFYAARSRLAHNRGNIIVYIVMVMLIFAALGVTMLSLFRTSTSSSATANDARRAAYQFESGMRYAASELVNGTPNFSSATIDRLNSTTYKIAADSTFKLKIFGLDFYSLSKINDDSTLTVNLKVHKGLLPADFTIPTAQPRIFLVNYQAADLGNLTTDQASAITGFTYQDATHLALDVEDAFIVAEREPVAFAVRPFQNDTISLNGALLVTRNAVSLFPRKNGAIVVNGKPYFYEDRIDSENPNYAKLTKIQSDPKISNPFPLVVTTASTYVILSPAIHIITAEGKSGEVTYTEDWHNQYGGSAYDRRAVLRLTTESRKPDIEFAEEGDLPGVLRKLETNTGIINVDNDPGDKFFSLSTAGGSFGAAWYKDTRPIGGVRNYSQGGSSLFNLGFRAFFLLTHSGGDGDGLTFSAINGALNDNGSAGGDVQLSELLAYAGDSRTKANPSGPDDFLDGKGQGLRAPKMALEFDGKVNNQNPSICANDTTVNLNTRNDPYFGVDKDMVQYVFWGSDTSINANCRINPLTGTNKTYDDNRHDSALRQVWVYDSGGYYLTSPALSTDGTAIYIGRTSANTLLDAGRLIKINRSDGSLIWRKNPDVNTTTGVDDYPDNVDDVDSSPAVSDAGSIYVGNDSDNPNWQAGRVFRFNSSGSRLAAKDLTGDVQCTPAVSNARTGLYDGKTRVYVVETLPAGTYSGAALWALTESSLNGIWSQGFFDINTSSFASPAIRYDATENKNYVYLGSDDGKFYVVRDNGDTREEVAHINAADRIRTTAAVNPVTGDVYFGSNDNNIYAITKYGVAKSGFPVTTGGDVRSSPAVTADGRTIYTGSDDGRLYIISVDAVGNWLNTRKYPPDSQSALGAIRSSPTIAPNGVVFFGSDDGHLYVLDTNNALWKYPTTGSIGAVRSKPLISPDGIVYFAAEDHKLYALEFSVNNLSNNPRLYLTPDQLGAGSGKDWLTDGPWAVRMEVQRSLTTNASGKYEYTLKSWMKKCQDAGCTNAVGNFYQNTRFEYDWVGAGISPMTQTIELSDADPDYLHTRFNRFLFGWTSASSASQVSTISNFQLSFIRPGDPLVHD